MNKDNNFKQKFLKMFGQAVKYGLVGVINTVITAVILFVMMRGFGISWQISNFTGYLAGFINSFIMNKIWTFNGNEASTFKQFVRFTIVFAVCYALQHGFVSILINQLNVDVNISQLIGMVFYTLIGFVLNKLITFKD